MTATKSKDKKVRMTWPTYNYLRCLVEAQQEKLEKDFQMACFFMEKGYPKRGKSAIEKAHEVFSKESAKLTAIKDELHDAIAESYKDHPMKEMREFWGLKD